MHLDQCLPLVLVLAGDGLLLLLVDDILVRVDRDSCHGVGLCVTEHGGLVLVGRGVIVPRFVGVGSCVAGAG